MVRKHKILILLAMAAFIFSAVYNVYAEQKALALAMVTGIYGKLSVNGDSAKMKQRLYHGNVVKTEGNSKATLLLKDKSEIKMAPKTTLTINDPDYNITEKRGLLVKLGKIFAKMTKQKSNFQISSPYGAAAIEGTELQVEVIEGVKTSVVVAEGSVQFKNTNNNVLVGKSFEGVSNSNKTPISNPKKVQYQNLIKWQNDIKTYIEVIDSFMKAFNEALQIKAQSGTGSLLKAQGQLKIITACQDKLNSMVPDPEFSNGHRYIKTAFTNAKTYLELVKDDDQDDDQDTTIFYKTFKENYDLAQREFTKYQSDFNKQVQKMISQK